MDTRITDCCALFYNATGLPVACFEPDGTREVAYPLWPTGLVQDVFTAESDPCKNPRMYIAPSQGMYGRVELESGGYIVMGPAYSIPINEAVLRSYMQENYIPFDQMDMAQALLYQSSNVSYARFVQNLAFLYYCLTGKIIDPAQHFGLEDVERAFTIAAKNARQMAEAKETKALHNTYQYEQRLFALIKDGKTDRLIQFLNENSTANCHIGTFADSPLRQAKNQFILTAAKTAVQSAIPGRLDIELTYQLVEHYIFECEQAMTIAEVERLSFIMLTDFCRRIGVQDAPEGISPEIYDCMCYIHENTNESISVTDVAQHIGRSNSYLLTRFKKETGISVGNYITQCKLEDAAHLLIYSDNSLASISSYLCFSSQSYFQNVFKKHYGVTPMQYRKQKKI